MATKLPFCVQHAQIITWNAFSLIDTSFYFVWCQIFGPFDIREDITFCVDHDVSIQSQQGGELWLRICDGV